VIEEFDGGMIARAILKIEDSRDSALDQTLWPDESRAVALQGLHRSGPICRILPVHPDAYIGEAQLNQALGSTDMSKKYSRPDTNNPLVRPSGRLIVNADDWGRDCETTDRTFDCIPCGTVSSVSAMVFMEDSERAAAMACEHGIDAGLHLNFTTSFTGAKFPRRLQECQQSVARFLSRHSMARAVFNPWLVRPFEYLVAAQREEFIRLYGTDAERFDGHHHMHLCSNVLIGKLLPPGKLVRRYFSYEPGQDIRNRVYRRFTDALLVRRHRVVDLFFSLPPLQPERLTRIFSLTRRLVVEVETHPAHLDEYRFLTGSEILRWTEACPVAPRYEFRPGDAIESR